MLQVRAAQLFAGMKSRSWMVAVIALAGMWAFTCASAAQPKNEDTNPQLKSFLKEYLKRYPPLLAQGLHYSAASVSLDGPSEREYFVYLASRWWCGSGGCAALLLEQQGPSFRVLERFTLARLPIVILPSKSNGWHDISMLVQGGGTTYGREVILRYDGHRYPSNPSMAPELPAKLAGQGTVLPLREQGTPLN